MRTKTLLLTAAALLAAGLVSTQAQPVYSQNIVGYASVQLLTPASYYAMAVPFVVGTSGSNRLDEVFPTNSSSTLSQYSQVLTWDAVGQGFVTSIFDPMDPQQIGDFAHVWYLSDDYTPVTVMPTVPPGQGFFVLPQAPVTNTFAGTVAINVGTSNKMLLPTPANYYMVGSVVPYAGAITNGSATTSGANLNALPQYTQVLTWDVNAQGFVTTIYDPLDPQQIGDFADKWYQSDDYTVAPVPTVTVGQAFFILPQASYTWTNSLPAN